MNVQNFPTSLTVQQIATTFCSGSITVAQTDKSSALMMVRSYVAVVAVQFIKRNTPTSQLLHNAIDGITRLTAFRDG